MHDWCKENNRAYTEAGIRAAMQEFFTSVQKEERKSDAKDSKSKDAKKVDIKARETTKRKESTVDSGDESQNEWKNFKGKKDK